MAGYIPPNPYAGGMRASENYDTMPAAVVTAFRNKGFTQTEAEYLAQTITTYNLLPPSHQIAWGNFRHLQPMELNGQIRVDIRRELAKVSNTHVTAAVTVHNPRFAPENVTTILTYLQYQTLYTIQTRNAAAENGVVAFMGTGRG